jgi:gamma-glutamylcysteine synthetase
MSVVNGIHYNVGLSTFLQSMMVTKKSTESIQKTKAINFVVLICNPITYNLSLNEDRLHSLHSVTKVKTE